jgi:hypothetical protein
MQLNDAEANFLRDKYKSLFDISIKKQSRDMILTKKIKALQIDLANEKIELEKARMVENEEMHRLQHVESERDELQKVIWITK